MLSLAFGQKNQFLYLFVVQKFRQYLCNIRFALILPQHPVLDTQSKALLIFFTFLEIVMVSIRAK